MYKQSIILFGIVLPLFLMGAVLGGLFFFKSQMDESYAFKTQKYKTYQVSQRSAMEIEAKIAKQRSHVARWKQELSGGQTLANVRSHMKEFTDKLPSKEFQETNFDPVEQKSGFAVVSAQKSSQLRLGFRGTYRTVERAFLELETRMPQLQCQELKIEPSSQSSFLNFEVNYTAWEN